MFVLDGGCQSPTLRPLPSVPMPDQVSGLLSPYLRRRRLEVALPYLSTGMTLDFGCGTAGLAESIDAERYIGVDIDPETLELARNQWPRHRFVHPDDLGPTTADVIVALAVLEHLSDPASFMHWAYRTLRPGGRLVATTPHPAFEWVHGAAAAIGLASKEAHGEHVSRLDRKRMGDLGREAGIPLVTYRRFLFGFNQLAVFSKD